MSNVIVQRSTLIGLSISIACAACKNDPPPAPTPHEIVLSAPTRLRERAKAPVSAVVKDATGATLASPVSWTFEPNDVVKHDGGALIALKEGRVRITATSGPAKAQGELTVVVPIVGTWVRKTTPFKGMAVSIDTYGDSLAGTIVKAPPADAEQVAYEKTLAGSIPQSWAETAAGCAEKAFPSGLQKYKNIKRISANKWSAGNLSKKYFSRGRCEEADVEYVEFELILVADDKMEVNNVTSRAAGTGAVQIWELLPDAAPSPAAASAGAPAKFSK